MTLRRHLFGLSSFVLLSAAVLFNAFYLQGMRPKIAVAQPDAPVLGAIGPAPVSPAPASSENVAAIQRELDQRGFAPGAADGIINPVTRAAIFAFELEQGLPLTAEPGDALLQALILGSSSAASQTPSGTRSLGPEADKLIHRVQRDLAALGYGPFPAQGGLSDETARAISKFERDQGLKVSGRVSAPLVARLMRLAPQEARRGPA